jgi:hypothetical protein
MQIVSRSPNQLGNLLVGDATVRRGTILVIALRLAEPMFTVSFLRRRCGVPRSSGYLNMDLLTY